MIEVGQLWKVKDPRFPRRWGEVDTYFALVLARNLYFPYNEGYKTTAEIRFLMDDGSQGSMSEETFLFCFKPDCS